MSRRQVTKEQLATVLQMLEQAEPGSRDETKGPWFAIGRASSYVRALIEQKNGQMREPVYTLDANGEPVAPPRPVGGDSP